MNLGERAALSVAVLLVAAGFAVGVVYLIVLTEGVLLAVLFIGAVGAYMSFVTVLGAWTVAGWLLKLRRKRKGVSE